MDTAIATRNTAALATSTKTALVDAFLRGRKQTTIDAYAHDLEDFAAFDGASSSTEAAERLVSLPHGEANAIALGYRSSLIERKLSPATINRRLAALRSLVKLGRTLGLVAWTLEVESVKSEKYRDTRGPSDELVTKLIQALRTRIDAKGRRDEAIIRCLYDLALRRGEVASLDLEHLDLVGGTVAILGKGRTQRETLTLPASTKTALEAWLQVRGNEAGPLFVALDRSSHGGRLTGDGVWHVVSELGADLGVKLRPHGLRHSAITKALDLTHGDVRKVQRFSRHKDLRVLTVYDDARQDLAGEVASLVSGSMV